MTGPMRNWQYVPPDWILPLDDFLNNPKLTDRDWFKLDDFYPALIAANRWNGKTGGGVGEGPLYSIPVLEESYILAYRKDIFDQYNIKVPTTLEEMAEAARAGEEERRNPRHRGARHTQPSATVAHRLHQRPEVLHRRPVERARRQARTPTSTIRAR